MPSRMTERREGLGRRPPKPERVREMRSYWLRSFIAIAVALLLAAMLLLYILVAREDRDGRRQLASGANALAERIAAEMGQLRGPLDAWPGDDELRSAFLSRSPDRLAAKERDLMTQVPRALGIHLFPAEKTTSLAGIPFVSYAGLDLARQAAQGRATTAFEVHKLGKKDMYLAIAVPVLAQTGDQAVGVVHVALPIFLLPSPVGVVGDRGFVLYQQVVGDAVATLGWGGDEPPPEPDYAEPISGTRLRVAGWLRSPGYLDPWLVGPIAGTFLVLLALVGFSLWRGSSALRRAVLLDFNGLIALVDDAVNRRPARMTEVEVRVAESRHAYQEMVKLLRRREPGRGPLHGAVEPLESEEQARAPVPADGARGPTSRLSEPSTEVEEIDLLGAFDPYADTDSLLLQMSQELERFPLEADEAKEASLPARRGPSAAVPAVPAEVFGPYDIRGIAERQLGPEAMRVIGRALGSEAVDRGDRSVAVGRDCRASSPALSAALIEGIRAAGAEVVDLGVVPTPLVYFACCHPEPLAGAMVTASHNPPEYNGVKMVFGGIPAGSDTVQALRKRIQEGDLASGSGGLRRQDAIAPYLSHVEQDVTLARSLRVAIDCGNATASAVAPSLFRALGCDLIELNCDMDAGMGKRFTDPSQPEDLHDLGGLVRTCGADIGFAFDADGDRLGVVDSQGQFVPADRVLMVLAADVLTRHPGSDVVYDVKCSRHLAQEIRRAGGRAVMVRSGHSPLKAKVRETGALIAGELSGHIVFNERWFGFDDALYAGARLLEVLALDPRTTHEVFAALPGGLVTPELSLHLPEGEPARVMRAMMQLADRLDGVEAIRIDGLRSEFDRGWGLVRASNTESKLVFRFEGDDREALDKIQSLYRRLMDKAAPGLSLPF